MERDKLSTKDLCTISVWVAIIAVMAQIAIPMPAGVPMTMQTFGITLGALILGPKKGAIATLVYVLLGLVGLPVFANFTGGIHKLVSPTGGFIVSFPLMAWIIGIGVAYKGRFKWAYVGGIILGTLINYVVGVIGFCFLTGGALSVGISACVIPFIPTAIIKIVIAGILGLKLRQRLVQFI